MNRYNDRHNGKLTKGMNLSFVYVYCFKVTIRYLDRTFTLHKNNRAYQRHTNLEPGSCHYTNDRHLYTKKCNANITEDPDNVALLGHYFEFMHLADKIFTILWY
jgi:hypothetical protein